MEDKISPLLERLGLSKIPTNPFLETERDWRRYLLGLNSNFCNETNQQKAEEQMTTATLSITEIIARFESMEKRIAALETELATLKQPAPKPKLEMPAVHKHPQMKADAWQKIDKLMQSPFVVVDTETADLKGEIIQLALINRDGLCMMNQFIKPKGIIAVAAQEVHGISEEKVKDAPPFADVWKSLRPILENVTIVSYGSYDLDRLNSDLRLNKIDYNLAQLRWFNSMPVVANWLGLTFFEGRYGKAGSYKFEKLETVCELLGVQLPAEKAHDALGDVLRTLEVLKAIQKRGAK